MLMMQWPPNVSLLWKRETWKIFWNKIRGKILPTKTPNHISNHTVLTSIQNHCLWKIPTGLYSFPLNIQKFGRPTKDTKPVFGLPKKLIYLKTSKIGTKWRKTNNISSNMFSHFSPLLMESFYRIWLNNLCWRSKYPRHDAFMVFKLLWKTFIHRLILYWSILISRIRMKNNSYSMLSSIFQLFIKRLLGLWNGSIIKISLPKDLLLLLPSRVFSSQEAFAQSSGSNKEILCQDLHSQTNLFQETRACTLISLACYTAWCKNN